MIFCTAFIIKHIIYLFKISLFELCCVLQKCWEIEISGTKTF